MFRVGIFLDFVWLTTRLPHGAYVRRARRNRIDPPGGGIERLGARTGRRGVCVRHGRHRRKVGLLAEEKSDSIFHVGIFLDFVRRSGTTRTMHTPHGACTPRRAKRNGIDPHRGGVERLEARTGGHMKTRLRPLTWQTISARTARQWSQKGRGKQLAPVPYDGG